jgi:AAA15 family ATPase/GTPase
MLSTRETVHIDSLILDPNNYRFIDRPEYKEVPEDMVSDHRVQQRTLNFIWGRNKENIKDLITSFRENSFLDIEQIQVKIVGDKYLVLEGNRRTATLKFFWEEYNLGMDIGNINPDIFSQIPVVVIDREDPIQHLITMGLHHISGKKRWSAVNEAQLMNDLIEIHGLPEGEVGKKLGISTYMLRRSRRTLYLINQFKESDYGDQFKTDMYYIFQSIVGSPILKEWIEWDDNEYKATNLRNTERLFNWLSVTDDENADDDDEKADLDKKNLNTREQIINQYRQIKTLEEIINDENALKIMETSGDLTKAYTFSKAVGESKLHNAIATIKDGMQLAYNFKDLITANDYDELKSVKDFIGTLLPISQAQIIAEERRSSIFFSQLEKQFSEIHIVKYRRLEDVTVKHINRINLFAGGNNRGKTTILETFYLLSQANNLNAYIDLVRYRGKFSGEFNSKWIDKYFTNAVELKSIFNNVEADLHIHKKETIDDIDKSGYINSLMVDASINSQDLTSIMHLFSNKSPEYRYVKTQILCTSAFTSPYRHNEQLLYIAHRQAIENKYFDEIISFINTSLDQSIEKIDLVNDQGEYRFKVSSNRNEQVLDLTEYGEGLQRVFEIALLLGYCKDGVLCIDEIDSALHNSLLIPFSQFVHRVAEKYNVQIFASTHSKECIDAFIKNDHKTSDITAYALLEEDGKIKCKYIDGERLEQLVESINFDIR